MLSVLPLPAARSSALSPASCSRSAVLAARRQSKASAPHGNLLSTEPRSVCAERFAIWPNGRNAICSHLLDQRDAWTTPIVINAQYPQANLPELPRLAVNLSQTGFGLKLQLDLTIDAAISRPEVRRELLRALLLEMIYRGESNIPAGTAYVSPPDWLLDGVPAEPSDMPLDRVANLLALPVAGRSVMPLEKFLQQKPELLDAPGRLLYRAYSFALVDLLHRAPEGRGAAGADSSWTCARLRTIRWPNFESIFPIFSSRSTARKKCGKGKSRGSPRNRLINC